MPKGVYAAASAMVVETRALEITARNIAHGETPGYRREHLLRSSFAAELAREGRTGQRDGGAGVLPAGSWFHFGQGGFADTGATFDLALSGEGFFRVRAPSGEVLLTRNGRFTVDEQGQLVTSQGFTVEGQGGPITIPPEAERISVDQAGRISITTTANGVVGESVIDQLRLSTVPDPSKLIPRNGVLFAPGDQPVSDAASARVHQGKIERGDVDSIRELVDMVAIQRRYDACHKAMTEQNSAGQGYSDLLRG